MTITRPRKTEARTIHSLHFPTKFLLQEFQGLSLSAWKAEGDLEAGIWFQQTFFNTHYGPVTLKWRQQDPDLEGLHPTESSLQKDRMEPHKEVSKKMLWGLWGGKDRQDSEGWTEKGIANPGKNILPVDSQWNWPRDASDRNVGFRGK